MDGLCAGFESNLVHCILKFILPMLSTMSKPVKGLLEEPQLAGLTEGATGGRVDNNFLIVRKERMTEDSFCSHPALGSYPG